MNCLLEAHLEFRAFKYYQLNVITLITTIIIVITKLLLSLFLLLGLYILIINNNVLIINNNALSNIEMYGLFL